MEQKTYNIITWILFIAAILAVLYDVTQNPQYGRKCELTDQFGNKIIGNCSYIIGYYHSQQNINDYMNLVGQLMETNGTTTINLTEDITTTTTQTTTTITYIKLSDLPTTSTTFKLKEQGSFSQHHPTTTTMRVTTTTLIPSWMRECETNLNCTIVYGCCPCSTPQAINKKYAGYYEIYIKNCPLKIQCGNIIRPCTYRAACSDMQCVKTME